DSRIVGQNGATASDGGISFPDSLRRLPALFRSLAQCALGMCRRAVGDCSKAHTRHRSAQLQGNGPTCRAGADDPYVDGPTGSFASLQLVVDGGILRWHARVVHLHFFRKVIIIAAPVASCDLGPILALLAEAMQLRMQDHRTARPWHDEANI